MGERVLAFFFPLQHLGDPVRGVLGRVQFVLLFFVRFFWFFNDGAGFQSGGSFLSLFLRLRLGGLRSLDAFLVLAAISGGAG
jgi:hypothetical protein